MLKIGHFLALVVQRRTLSSVDKDRRGHNLIMVKRIERRIKSENTFTRHGRVKEQNAGGLPQRPRDSRRCLVAHIAGTAVCGFPLYQAAYGCATCCLL